MNLLKRMFRIGSKEQDVVEFSEPSNTLSEEIATRSASWNFFALSMYLPNPDPVLKAQGKDQKIYRDLTIDSRVWAAIQSRKAGVMSLNCELNQGESNSTVFDIMDGAFKELDLHHIISQVLDSVFFGYSPIEIVWNPKTWTPKDLIGRPPEWFHFDQDNKLRFKAKSSPMTGIELDPRQFLCPVSNPSYLNPYGEPLAARIFWPATFKKGGFRFWVTFTEKYGMPWVIGKHPTGADQETIDRMADQLEAMVQDAIAVIPEGAAVEVKPTGATANAEIYEKLINQMNQEITTAILGHAGAGESTPGKLGNEGGAMDVRQDLVDSDRRLVEATFKHLIQIIAEVNGLSGPLPVFRLYADEDVDQSLAERDEKLTKSLQASGLKLSRKYYIKAYGMDEDDLEDVPVPATPAPIFSEAVPVQKADNLEDLITRMVLFQDLARPNGDGAIVTGEFQEVFEKMIEHQATNQAQVVEVIRAFAERQDPTPGPIQISLTVPEPKKSFSFNRDEGGRINGADVIIHEVRNKVGFTRNEQGQITLADTNE